jgi:serine/threonine protein kinase
MQEIDSYRDRKTVPCGGCMTAYNFHCGQILARKYEVTRQLSTTRVSEFYQLNERITGIERTAKFFSANLGPAAAQVARTYAMKLHKLRDCDILMPYRTHETFSYRGHDVTFLVSDQVEGELLETFLAHRPAARLNGFEGLHLLHALAQGVEKMHCAGEHHGELTSKNIMIRRIGLGFRVKMLDFGPLNGTKPAMIKQDVEDLIKLFVTATGGPARWAKQARPVQLTCQALRRSFNEGQLRNAGDLRRHLESLAWK